MFNNLFQQQSPVAPNNNMFGGMPMMGGFNQNNGLNFGNVAPAKTTSSTPEELALIKAKKADNFTMTESEMAIANWDFREGQQLALEIVDPATERVRVKYTNEEFNIVMQPVEVLKEYLNGLRNFLYTTKVTDTTDNPEVLKQLFGAFGIIDKLLPPAYENGQKNYQTLSNQMSQMMSAQGYQGTWGGQQMFNGAIGAVPNYFVPDGSTMGNFNNFQNVQPQNGVINPAMMQQMLQQAAAMGAQSAQQQMLNAASNAAMGTPMPTGGTMMGANPFVMGGQPQQMPTATPTMAAPTATPPINSIPMPGAPVTPSGTANPSMGTGTTATASV